MLIGTSKTWSYINNQLDYKRRCAVHIVVDENKPWCRHGGTLDELDDVSEIWFMEYDWACKHCLRRLSKAGNRL